MTSPNMPAGRTRESGLTVDAGRLWPGGIATAVVAALIALAGVLVCRWLFGIPLLAPKSDGAYGDVHTTGFVLAAAAAAIIATALMHLLLVSTPRPIAFFNWIVGLATLLAVADHGTVPGLTGEEDPSADLAALAKRFHEAHRRRYGHMAESEAVEIVNFQVTAVGAHAGHVRRPATRAADGGEQPGDFHPAPHRDPRLGRRGPLQHPVDGGPPGHHRGKPLISRPVRGVRQRARHLSPQRGLGHPSGQQARIHIRQVLDEKLTASGHDDMRLDDLRRRRAERRRGGGFHVRSRLEAVPLED